MNSGSPNAPKTTPMMEQYHAVKRDYPGELLFFRMGDFYEMMFEDAIQASEVLGITLTKRGRGTACEAPMCGVPFHAADSYIAKLVKNGYRVAICDQVEDPKQAKGLVRREVVRVITPGTLLDEAFMDGKDFQYLSVILEEDDGLGTAFVEFSTGRFEVCQFEGSSRFQELGDLLVTKNPAEILTPDDQTLDWLDPGFLAKRCHTRLESWQFSLDVARNQIIDHFEVAGLEGFGLYETPLAVRAAGAALAYLNQTQKGKAAHIESIKTLNTQDFLVLDAATQRNLELTQALFDGSRRESLLGQIDFTSTAMGSRLLKEWILQPLCDIPKIHERQTFITSYRDATIPRTELRELLGHIPDVDRQLSRLAMRTISPRALVGLSQALAQLPEILRWVNDVVPDGYGLETDLVDQLIRLEQRISSTLKPEAPSHTRDGGFVAAGVDAELDDLRSMRRDSRSMLTKIESRERERTQIPKLKVQYNKVFGYYIEVSKVHAHKVPHDYVRKQTLVNSERYITDELKRYEDKILGAEEKILVLEQRIFDELVNHAVDHLPALRVWSHALAEIDVHTALAELAVQRNYHRPEVTSGTDIVIQEGRHPVVEALSEEPFIPNDTYLNQDHDRVLIITGPNMGGKSTYLRQVALICLMAQMGSYVPATKAEIGIVDRIFTRVGASDQLSRGQSTFMVEMTETANILHHASQRSLIILDEIGRGTATFDGLSIAWATAEYIHDPHRIGAKTLFATHYHELTELEKCCPGVTNLHITVREWKHDIVFLRRIERGTADKSYGIHVAKLAGLPKDLISRAREILANLEKNELDTTGNPKLARGRRLNAPPEAAQLPLFPNERSPILDELAELSVDDVTPRQALEILFRWKDNL